MQSQPTLVTERLILRPFFLSDAPAVQQFAADRAVAANTLAIPHPYPEGEAERWIRCHAEQLAEGKAVHFAIVQHDNTLCGTIHLGRVPAFQLAELGYWIGRPFWGRGYCTEAGRAVLAYGFNQLELNRIQGTHFADNPASGRVMEKMGLLYEGCRREHTVKWGEFKDIKLYGLLRKDYQHHG